VCVDDAGAEGIRREQGAEFGFAGLAGSFLGEWFALLVGDNVQQSQMAVEALGPIERKLDIDGVGEFGLEAGGVEDGFDGAAGCGGRGGHAGQR